MALNFSTECTEKWKLNTLSIIIDETEDIVADLIEKEKIKSADNYKNILIRALGKSVITFREIITLSAFVPFPKKWTEKLVKKRNKNKPKMSKVD